MSEEKIILGEPPFETDNEVKAFQIEGMDVRGRALRLGTAVDQILSAHNYPDRVGTILGEVLALTGLLGSILKYDGTLTIQAKAEGAISLLVADFKTPGELRGYAQFKPEAIAALADDASLYDIFGKGYLAMTIDQGADMERYQGIVDLDGESISACAAKYFQSSEQTPSAVRLAAGRDVVSGNWRAGGIMVQHLARGEVGQERLLDADQKEAWRRASILMESVKDQELLDVSLELDQLLFRLYHEDGVRVQPATHLKRGCRCDNEKLAAIISQFSKEDIEDMAEDGAIGMTCEFCNKTFSFPVP